MKFSSQILFTLWVLGPFHTASGREILSNNRLNWLEQPSPPCETTFWQSLVNETILPTCKVGEPLQLKDLYKNPTDYPIGKVSTLQPALPFFPFSPNITTMTNCQWQIDSNDSFSTMQPRRKTNSRLLSGRAFLIPETTSTARSTRKSMTLGTWLTSASRILHQIQKLSQCSRPRACWIRRKPARGATMTALATTMEVSDCRHTT